MKKCILLSVVLCVIMAFAMAETLPTQGSTTTISDIYTICLGDKGHNTGHCSEKTNGLGSACVKKKLFQRRDCYSSKGR